MRGGAQTGPKRKCSWCGTCRVLGSAIPGGLLCMGLWSAQGNTCFVEVGGRIHQVLQWLARAPAHLGV
eukprot:5890504-Alexandrium_andersonii.AAC.1